MTKYNKLKLFVGDNVKNAVQSNEFAYLAEYDQLTQQKELGNVNSTFKLKCNHNSNSYRFFPDLKKAHFILRQHINMIHSVMIMTPLKNAGS
jgi:hypothetical protein